MRDTEREREAETQSEGEAGSMQGARCWTRSRDSIPGLNPRTPGSRPGPKAGTKPLSHPGIPGKLVLFKGRVEGIYYWDGFGIWRGITRMTLMLLV